MSDFANESRHTPAPVGQTSTIPSNRTARSLLPPDVSFSGCQRILAGGCYALPSAAACQQVLPFYPGEEGSLSLNSDIALDGNTPHIREIYFASNATYQGGDVVQVMWSTVVVAVIAADGGGGLLYCGLGGLMSDSCSEVGERLTYRTSKLVNQSACTVRCCVAFEHFGRRSPDCFTGKIEKTTIRRSNHSSLGGGRALLTVSNIFPRLTDVADLGAKNALQRPLVFEGIASWIFVRRRHAARETPPVYVTLVRAK